MFYRKIIDKLEEWSQRANRKPLVQLACRFFPISGNLQGYIGLIPDY